MDQSNVELWTVIMGFLLPPLISAINRHRSSGTTKAIVAFLVCAAVAAVGSYVDGTLDHWEDPVRTFLVVFVTAIGTFHLWWRPSGLTDRIERQTG